MLIFAISFFDFNIMESNESSGFEVDSLQVSLLINKQTGGKKKKKKEGKGDESETCRLRVPKTRLGVRQLNFDWLFH